MLVRNSAAEGSKPVRTVNDDTGKKTQAGEFRPEVSVKEIIDIILANAEVADWMITSTGEPLIVAEGSGDES